MPNRVVSEDPKPHCFECGETADHEHHVVPRSRGGTRTVPLCIRCHGLAHDRLMGSSQLTRAALAAKKAKGERTGGVPTGFKLADDGKTLAPDSHEQEAIAFMRVLRAHGLSYAAIGAQLESRGFRPRGAAGRWHAMTIMRALKNAGADDA
jgi:hypothetical protein